MTNPNDSDKVYLACPRCKEMFQETFGWLRHVTAPICPKCGSDISGYVRGFRDGFLSHRLQSRRGGAQTPDNPS